MPTIRGMRITVAEVLEMLGAGMSEAEVLTSLPYLELDDIRAAVTFSEREAKIAAMQQLIDEAYASGFLEESPEQIVEEALRAVGA